MTGDSLKKQVVVRRIGDHPAIAFAAAELQKYIGRLTRGNMPVVPETAKVYDPAAAGVLWVGPAPAFDIETFSAVKDTLFDDAVHIDVDKGAGIIAGINPRSVLIGVYRFLAEAGCRWVRPGIDGEYVPERDICRLKVRVSEKAAYRHRGICIEGANSNENILDIIDWLPKVGLNAYFIQFRESFTFYDRWYSHKNNPMKKPELFTVEKAREYVGNAEKEIKKRDLIYHAVGHGWTCEPFGIPGLGWDAKEYDIAPEIRQHLALVNGKREIWGGIPLNTSLCYSDPRVRSIVVNDIADYLAEHENIDILHFWLADATNNQCECENCSKAIPSEFYVKMLNELDEVLASRKIDTKIVFLIYVDLLWAPETERIKNPDRFILMFAPITRTYSRAFDTDEALPETSPYVRNKLKFPSNVAENLAFLKSWQRMFDGDSFDFDYHFMWDHYLDQGYCKIAEIVGTDVKNLGKIGLNGLVSCQEQRVFFPTGLGMYIMARTLWDTGLDFGTLAADYFDGAFGSDGRLCLEYMTRLSDLFDPMYLRGEKPPVNPESAERFRRIPGLVNEFKPVMEKNISLSDRCHSTSWQYLKIHADMCILLAHVLEALASDDKNSAESGWEDVKRFVCENEDRVQGVFDVFEFVSTLDGRIKRRLA